MTMTKCPKCGSTDIDKGRSMSAGAVAYLSDVQKTIFVGDNTATYLCMACGYTEMYVSDEYRNKIREKKQKLE